MTKAEVLQAFFEAWEAFEKLEKPKGRPSLEYMAAKDLLQMKAQAVRNWVPEAIAADSGVANVPNAALAEYRNFRQQVSAIEPKDTRPTTPHKAVTNV